MNPTPNSDPISAEQVQRLLDAQPFSRELEMRLDTLDVQSQRLSISLPLHGARLQQHGFVHGGVLSALADVALAFMGGVALGPQVLTNEFKINFLRPARGERLQARASVISRTRRQAVTRCDLFALAEASAQGQAAAEAKPAEKLVATALGTVVVQESLPDKVPPQ